MIQQGCEGAPRVLEGYDKGFVEEVVTDRSG